MLVDRNEKVKLRNPSAVVVLYTCDDHGAPKQFLAVKDDERIQVFDAADGEFVRTVGQDILRRPFGKGRDALSWKLVTGVFRIVFRSGISKLFEHFQLSFSVPAGTLYRKENSGTHQRLPC